MLALEDIWGKIKALSGPKTVTGPFGGKCWAEQDSNRALWGPRPSRPCRGFAKKKKMEEAAFNFF